MEYSVGKTDFFISDSQKMSIHNLLDDPLMFYDGIIRYMWFEDILTLHLLSSRFYSVMKSLEEKISSGMTSENFIEDYWKYIDSIRKSIDKKKDFLLGWKRFSVSMKYNLKREQFRGPIDNKEMVIIGGDFSSLKFVNKESNFDGKYYSWFSDGTKCNKAYHKNGELHGKFVEYHRNGSIEKEYFYKNHKLHGSYKRWFSNGQIREECFYKDGKQEGKCVRFFGNGQIYEEYFYKDGEEDGKYVRFFENGQRKLKAYCLEGKCVGRYQEWDENGVKIEDCYYS